MKKLYFLIILASMVFLYAGCGDKKVEPETPDPPCVGDECEDAPPAPPDPPEPEPEPDPEPEREAEPKEDEPDPEPEPPPETKDTGDIVKDGRGVGAGVGFGVGRDNGFGVGAAVGSGVVTTNTRLARPM